MRESWLDTDSPVRPLLVAIFGWVAEQERTRLIERTKTGMARARREGKKIGRPRTSAVLLHAAADLVSQGVPAAEAARCKGPAPACAGGWPKGRRGRPRERARVTGLRPSGEWWPVTDPSGQAASERRPRLARGALLAPVRPHLNKPPVAGQVDGVPVKATISQRTVATDWKQLIVTLRPYISGGIVIDSAPEHHA